MVVNIGTWHEVQNYFTKGITGSILGPATEKSGYMKWSLETAMWEAMGPHSRMTNEQFSQMGNFY